MPLIDLTDVRLYYRVSGSGPAVLLIPGLGQIASAWDPIVPALAEHFLRQSQIARRRRYPARKGCARWM